MNRSLSAMLVAAAAAGVLAAPAAAQDAVYVAQLHAMNSKVAGGQTTGEVRLVVHGDSLAISVKVKGAPASMEHWQHFHGFKDGHAASCPTQSADANHDGIVDLIETGPASGTTMVPFDADPAGMDVAHGTYPSATASGSYEYHQVVSLKALDAAFGKAFDGKPLALDRRVVFIHGVPSATTLAASVASLGPIPAQVTLPIACGKLERAKR